MSFALFIALTWFAAVGLALGIDTTFNNTDYNRALRERGVGGVGGAVGAVGSRNPRLRAEITQMVNDAFNDVQSNWTPPTPPKPVNRKSDVREILLLGDSLLMLPSRQFKIENQLGQLLEEAIAGVKVHVSIFTVPGARCVSMKDLFQRKADGRLSSKKPGFDAVIIYWDSDIVDLDNPDLPEVKREYIRNLIIMLKTLKAYTQYVAIAGPTFSKNRGEMPEQWAQDFTYESYLMINQEVSRLLQVEHINTRRKFQDFIIQQKKMGMIPKELPKVKDWDEFESIEGGIVTFDGQHTHEQGSKLLVKSFAEYLLRLNDLWGTNG